MATATVKALYETDFVEWAERTSELLRAGRLDEVDLELTAEEIEGLAKKERSAAASQLYRMLVHLIKRRIQPERAGSSWRRSIAGGQASIALKLDDSPSLRRHAQDRLQKIYERAVKGSLFETGLTEKRRELNLPEQCPYSLDDLLEGSLIP
jgi:Domain of unknown function DUF29